jgi:hypothetical protein
VFVELSAMNATHSLPPNAARDRADWLAWPMLWLADQWTPSGEEHMSTLWVELFATNATHSWPLNSASDGAVPSLAWPMLVFSSHDWPFNVELTRTLLVLLFAMKAVASPLTIVYFPY